MRKILFLLTSVFVLLILINVISASLADVKYPVYELGNCSSQAECEKYCDNIENIEVCINFAEKNGIMTPEEIADAKKFLPLIKAGKTPGKCASEKQCDEYCNKEENLNECIEFALSIGEIDEKEAEMIKKTGGRGPGGCKREECDKYCDDESHINECVDFAVKYGLMPAEEAEMAKKTGGRGPGGCKSKESCEAFCKNPNNKETCTNFAIEHGLISPEEIERIKKGLEWEKSPEGQCMMQCMKEAGASPDACGENGAGPEACRICGNKCNPRDSGNCLKQEDWEQKNQECISQGEGYHLEDIKGDNGQGGECVVDMKCVQGNFQQGQDSCGDCVSICESRPGQKLRGTDCINNQCQCFYEDEQQEQQPPGGENPGSSDSSSGSSADSGSSDSTESSSSSGGENSGGEAASVTGGAISEGNLNNNLLIKIIKWIFGI